jgi:hypothetical protein
MEIDRFTDEELKAMEAADASEKKPGQMSKEVEDICIQLLERLGRIDAGPAKLAETPAEFAVANAVNAYYQFSTLIAPYLSREPRFLGIEHLAEGKNGWRQSTQDTKQP